MVARGHEKNAGRLARRGPRSRSLGNPAHRLEADDALLIGQSFEPQLPLELELLFGVELLELLELAELRGVGAVGEAGVLLEPPLVAVVPLLQVELHLSRQDEARVLPLNEEDGELEGEPGQAEPEEEVVGLEEEEVLVGAVEVEGDEGDVEGRDEGEGGIRHVLVAVDGVVVDLLGPDAEEEEEDGGQVLERPLQHDHVEEGGEVDLELHVGLPDDLLAHGLELVHRGDAQVEVELAVGVDE
mmetsp:Transcript_8922/g.15120  ORF Transcript_8922/g.15120 Transcript_8922/m.15120 type:complete len:243 (-) Transcript_8922:1510-2238(-)